MLNEIKDFTYNKKRYINNFLNEIEEGNVPSVIWKARNKEGNKIKHRAYRTFVTPGSENYDLTHLKRDIKRVYDR